MFRAHWIAVLLATAAAEPIARPVTIALLNDKTSVFADAGGTGSLSAAQLAVDDAGCKVRGQPIVLLGPDHRYKRIGSRFPVL